MPGKPVTWRRGPGVFPAQMLITEVAGEHFGAPWPDLSEAQAAGTCDADEAAPMGKDRILVVASMIHMQPCL